MIKNVLEVETANETAHSPFYCFRCGPTWPIGAQGPVYFPCEKLNAGVNSMRISKTAVKSLVSAGKKGEGE